MEKTRGVRRVLCALLPVLCFLAAPVRSQTVQEPSGFVLNVNRPFVYVKFDHIGPGVPRSEDEPKLRIWLRLTNNCPIPILVRANGVPDESPKDEVGVQYDVVRKPEGKVAFVIDKPGSENTRGQQKATIEELPKAMVSTAERLCSVRLWVY